MKAIVYTQYGPPDVLRVEDVEEPVPKDDEVLIAVRAASVNPLDRHLMRGPYIVRAMAGVRKPRLTRLGVDLAGCVEAVGKNVTAFKAGDEVFGSGEGAFAEYACAPESKLAAKPASMTFEQAAAVPVAGLTALQALRDKGKVQPGQKVLINGAGGGVGTFAVQIAKSFGAEVTGVCSTRSAGMVRSIGADHVVDYKRDDFTKSGQRYDVMLDCIGNHSISACRRVLDPKGVYLIIGGQFKGALDPLPSFLGAMLTAPFVSQKIVVFMAKGSKDDLAVMRELIEGGKVTPVIDRRYPLSGVAEAIRYLEDVHARGKIIITMEERS